MAGFVGFAHTREASTGAARVEFVSEVLVREVADSLVVGTVVELAEPVVRRAVRVDSFRRQNSERQWHAKKDLPPSRLPSSGSAAMFRQDAGYHGQDHHQHRLLLDALQRELHRLPYDNQFHAQVSYGGRLGYSSRIRI